MLSYSLLLCSFHSGNNLLKDTLNMATVTQTAQKSATGSAKNTPIVLFSIKRGRIKISGISKNTLRSSARNTDTLAFPRAIKVCWQATCAPNIRGNRHINPDRPARIFRQRGIAGKDHDENLREEHGQRPQKRGIANTAEEQDLKRLLHAVRAASPIVKADDGLGALGQSLKRKHGKLHDTAQYRHGAYRHVSAVAKQG